MKNRRMVKALRIFAYLIIALLLLAVALVSWLAAGERDMNWARGWLISALNPAGAPYSITVGEVSVDWRSVADFGNLRVRNMVVAGREGVVFAELPQVSVTIDPIGFLPHRRSLHGILIEKPRLYLQRDAEGVVRVGLRGAKESMPVKDLLGFFAAGTETEVNDGRGMVLPFRQLALEQAQLSFTDEISGARLVGAPMHFRIHRRRGEMEGELSLPFTYNDKKGFIDASLMTQGGDRLRIINANLQEVPSELACMFGACPENFLVAGPVGGKITAKFDRADRFVEATVSGTTDNMLITAPELFEKPLNLKKSSIIFTASDEWRKVDVTGLSLGLKHTTIIGKGSGVEKEDGWYLTGEGSAGSLDISKLHLYWPIPMAADTREWVLSKIKAGSATATLKFNFTPEDFSGDSFIDDHIDSTILAKDIDFIYLPGFPMVHDVTGTVHFTGKTMTITSNGSGTTMTGSKLGKAMLLCPDLDHPNAPMKADLELSSPASDVATMLKMEHFTFDDGFNLDPASITGTFDARMKLGFDGFTPGAPKDPNYVNLNNVSYDIDATLSNVAQPKLFQGRDVAGLSGKLHADNKAAHFDGNMKLDGGTDIALVLDDKDGPGNTMVEAKGMLARSQFASFGIPELPGMGEGSISLDVALGIAEGGYSLQRAKVDLTQLELTIPEISWSKPKGEAASFSLTPQEAPRSYALDISGDGLSAPGASLTLNETGDDVTQIILPKVKTATNDFALNYRTTAEGYDVNLYGKKLDASTSYNAEDKNEAAENSLLADFPPINLRIDLAELVLMKEFPLRNLKGRLHCNKTRCESANLTLQTGKAGVIATITRDAAGKRNLNLTASDAGDFLRALDITDRMYGGKLALKGPYDDAQAPPQLRSRLVIEDFKLKNSQILARILSIGSLSGLVNVLTGAGIDFEKLSADIYSKAGVITVDNGRATSNAIGITVEGNVDTTKSGLALKGVVVPANLLNSIFGKIPLIGALAGGEGEGLIAFNYSVKGTYADPEVFVNPLSGLTPGFLRGIWGKGDTTVPEPEKKEEGTEEGTPEATSPSPAHDVSSPPTASQSLVPDYQR